MQDPVQKFYSKLWAKAGFQMYCGYGVARFCYSKEKRRANEQKAKEDFLEAVAERQRLKEAKLSRWAGKGSDAPQGQQMQRGRSTRMKQLKREAKAGDATAQQELDNERIRFFSRQAPAWKKVLLALVTVMNEILHRAIPVFEIPGVKSFSPFKALQKFMTVKWKYDGATFHGKRLAFHCTFCEFWKFWLLELLKSICTLFLYNIYHTYHNSMLLEHWLDARLAWADQEFDPEAVDPTQTDFVVFRAGGVNGLKKVLLRAVETFYGPCIGCLYPDLALQLVMEETDMIIIGGQGFKLVCSATENADKEPDKKSPKFFWINCCDCTFYRSCMVACLVAPSGEKMGRRDPKTGEVECCQGKDHPACCTKFHKVYCRKMWCPLPVCCPCIRQYNEYIDDHLEWKAGSEHVKSMILEAGKTTQRRISAFALAGTPFSAQQRQSLTEDKPDNEVELTEVKVVADAEAQPGDSAAINAEDAVSNPISQPNEAGASSSK